MALNNFRSAFMPYCLDRQDDGRYVVLNREYKPVGFVTSEWVKYDDYPVAVAIKGLGSKTAAKLSCHDDEDLDRIYLYNDGSVPTSSVENMRSYLEKLKMLADMEIE